MKRISPFFITLFLLFCSQAVYASTVFPFQYIDGKMFVEVKIKKKNYNFIFDTGAFTILSDNLLKEIKYSGTKYNLNANDANNAQSKLNVYQLNSIQVADLNINNVNFSFANISWMESRACRKVDGILGANILDGKVWTIDFKNKRITVSESRETVKLNSLISMPFKKENFTSVPKIMATIKGRSEEFLFDTGSGSSISVNKNLFKHINESRVLISKGYLSQSINSMSIGERQLFFIDTTLNGNTLNRQAADSDASTSNIIGTKFMEQFVVTVDFVQNIIVMMPTNGEVEKPVISSFGFTLAPIDGKITVVNKWEIPETSNINLSDQIVQVDDMAIREVNSDTYCRILDKMLNSNEITVQKSNGEKFVYKKLNLIEKL